MARIYTKDMEDFARFDESVSDTNAYLNVRDIYQFKRNHNAILGQAMRRCLGTFTFEPFSGTECVVRHAESVNSIVAENAIPIIRARVPISGYTNKLEYWVRAKLNSATYAQEVRLHLLISDPNMPRNISRKNAVTFDTDAVVQEKYGTATLPYTQAPKTGAHYDYEIGLYMMPELTTANIIVGTASIISATTTTVTCTAASLANVTTGDMIETTGEEKMIVKSKSIAAPNATLTVYGQYKRIPTVQIVHATHVPTITIEHASIYEAESVSFDFDLDRI